MLCCHLSQHECVVEIQWHLKIDGLGTMAITGPQRPIYIILVAYSIVKRKSGILIQ
jgi:hypothetical protein